MPSGRGLILPGVHVSPNIQDAPSIYEIENRAVDPEGKIEETMKALAPWEGKIVLDLGAGDGFYLERFDALAAHVIAVEPYDPSRLRAMARVAALGLTRTSVMTGSAEQILLPDASVDIVHARFAYFFAPDCEPGLLELVRVVRSGGVAFIVDNDLRSGTFAAWLRRSPWAKDADVVEGFWTDHGFTLHRVVSEWRFESRADLEAVVRIEFPGHLGEQILEEHKGSQVDYHYCLYVRRYS